MGQGRAIYKHLLQLFFVFFSPLERLGTQIQENSNNNSTTFPSTVSPWTQHLARAQELRAPMVSSPFKRSSGWVRQSLPSHSLVTTDLLCLYGFAYFEYFKSIVTTWAFLCLVSFSWSSVSNITRGSHLTPLDGWEGFPSVSPVHTHFTHSSVDVHPGCFHFGS